MNDYDKANSKIGNRFDLVLVAGERMREIHRQRRRAEEAGDLSLEERRKQPLPHWQAVNDIEEGLVGREYLDRLKDKPKPRRKNFDPI